MHMIRKGQIRYVRKNDPISQKNFVVNRGIFSMVSLKKSNDCTPPKYIVAIGASAGGLDPIQTFYNHMPVSDTIAFVIVQHLSPDFASKMDELLIHNTTMPIFTAKNNMPLEAGAIYLVPAAFEARIEKDRFQLTALDKKSLSLPINTLFESIAMAYGKRSIGIILSGTGADGTLGIIKISDNKGITMAQTPMESQFPDMPNNAIATKKVSCVLHVSEMPDAIMEYIHQPDEFNQEYQKLKFTGQSEFDDIFHLLNKVYKINFRSYKPTTVSRRIERRMQVVNIKNLKDYVAYLKKNTDALHILYQDLLIGVTGFFRDRNAFIALREEIIPSLFEKYKETGEDLRIWINPCATGEEAYSIVILLKEYTDEHNLPFAVKIFASDISDDFIKKAKKGCYEHELVACLPKNILNKYFIKSEKYYEIIPVLKQKILFFTHNLLTDAPFTKLDLICCRNLLIYIQPKEQKRITDFMRFGLKIGGFLFLGPSENIPLLEPDLIVKEHVRNNFYNFSKSCFIHV